MKHESGIKMQTEDLKFHTGCTMNTMSSYSQNTWQICTNVIWNPY